MADLKFNATNAKVIDDPRDSTQSVADATKTKLNPNEELVAWVTSRLESWRDHRRANYEADWDTYERLWRMIWSGTEQMRKSERSKVVTPALSEAVENSVAEAEEAIFGRGDFFDIRSEAQDVPLQREATERNKTNLKEDLARTGYVANTAEALIYAAVYGTGIGEIVMKARTIREPEAVLDADGNAIDMKVKAHEVTYACLQSVSPRNFLIDPNAKTIDDALGCAVEEYVGAHIVRKGQEEGDYAKVSIGVDDGDLQITKDPQGVTEPMGDKVHVFRYYGLVPKRLLFPPEQTQDVLGAALEKASADAEETSDDGFEDKTSTEPVSTEMVEAVIVIVNKKTLLKAVETPYLMADRPVIAFPWDIVPGRFMGRGVCEKGATPQKVLDAEIRSRMDALAYSGAPMMGMDASRLPRGFKMEVYPGKSILTNGDPSTVLKPFQFGQVDQNTYQQADYLDRMVQRATGALDNVAQAQNIGDARTGAVSMSLSGIVKRHKRTLMSFIDRFMVPSLEKILWRMMQFYPERYMPLNFTFLASSTMGIMQREYETQQLVQLLQTMDPKTPEYKVTLMGVVGNTGLTNRAGLIKLLNESIERDSAAQQQALAAATTAQTDPLQAQLGQVTLQLQIAEVQAKIRKLNAEAGLIAQKTVTEQTKPELQAHELALKGVYQTPEEQMQAEFDRRMKIGDQLIAAEDVKSNERIAVIQAGGAVREAELAAAAQAAQATVAPPPAAPAPLTMNFGVPS